MLPKLLAPEKDLATLLVRLGLAAIVVVHGYIKVVQDFPLGDIMSVEAWTAVGWVELICGLLLTVGLFSRVAALGLIPIQIGAIAMVTHKYAMEGLVIKKEGANYHVVGPEYNLALIVMCLVVVLLGSGAVSVDSLLWKWWQRRQATTSVPTPAPAPAPAGVE